MAVNARPRSFVIALISLLVASLAAPFVAAHESPTEDHTGTVPLKGVVTDAASGKPLPGANVYAYSFDGTAKDHDVTDDEGRYFLWLAEGKSSLRADLQDYSSYEAEVDAKEAGGLYDFAMKPIPPPGAKVFGTVLGSDGQPLAGAIVTIQTGYVHYSDAVASKEAPPPSDADGSAGSEGSAGSAEPGASIARPMPVPDEWEWKQAKTDENGFFSLAVHPGTKQVTIEARGHASTSKTFEAVEGENDLGDFRLEKVPPMNAVLRGRILDRDTGLPVAGASVSIQNLAWGRYNWTQTDENGYYEVRTLPGYTRVDVWAQRMMEPMPLTDAIRGPDCLDCKPAIGPVRSYYGWSATLTLESGEQTLDAKLKPKPEPTIVVQGYVIDAETKKAIANAWVNVRNEDTNEWGYAQTDADGSYKIRVREGYLVFDAGAQDYFNGVEMLELDGSVGVVRLDILAQPGTTKYAPCDECYAYAYAEDGAMRASGAETAATPGGAPAPAPAATGFDSASAPVAPKTLSSGAPSAEADSAGGGATYAGEPGGLGPYNAAEAPAPGEGTPLRNAETSSIPGASVALALGALGALAIALRRK